MRRPLPRGEPNTRRRSETRRCEFRLYSRLGMERFGPVARDSQRTAHLRVRPAFTKELQVTMNFTLRVWRQHSADEPGRFVSYQVKDVTPDMSFLEMLDALNEDLISRQEPPVAFEHDCREGICGSCGFLINGVAHGGQRGTTVCQLAMRFFKNGDALTLEPWRGPGLPRHSRSNREPVSI